MGTGVFKGYFRTGKIRKVLKKILLCLTRGITSMLEVFKMDEIRYGDHRRKWDPSFIEYMKMIVNHQNYAGMPSALDEQKQIRWNAPSNRPPGGKWSNLHDERLDWWRKKAKKLGVRISGYWISKVAKMIHPTGKKPCQTCGKIRLLSYVYPTKSTIQKINKSLGETDKIAYFEFNTIYEVIKYLFDVLGEETINILRSIFPQIPDRIKSKRRLIEYFKNTIVPSEPKGKLSPGAMSNAPDRLDGFHTYNICCRSKQDTGRDSENLRTYTDDRRAFEQWCEGNWAAANLLMNLSKRGVCVRCGKKVKITADHIGPISLGFAHTPYFAPMCTTCNSSKNNRMAFLDVKELLDLEKRGVTIVSWQAKTLWNKCKHKITDDQKALLLSKLLRINQHHYLSILRMFLDEGLGDVLLQFLNTDCVKYKYEFEDLNPTTFSFSRIKTIERSTTYFNSKSARMTRIAYEALLTYGKKEKRNIQTVDDEKLTFGLKTITKSVIRAKRMKSDYRDKLNLALHEKDVSKRAQKLQMIFRNKRKADYNFSFVRKAIQSYLNQLAEVLVKRFNENRSIRRGD